MQRFLGGVGVASLIREPSARSRSTKIGVQNKHLANTGGRRHSRHQPGQIQLIQHCGKQIIAFELYGGFENAAFDRRHGRRKRPCHNGPSNAPDPSCTRAQTHGDAPDPFLHACADPRGRPRTFQHQHACADPRGCSRPLLHACADSRGCSRPFLHACTEPRGCSRPFLHACTEPRGCSRPLLHACTDPRGCSRPLLHACTEPRGCSRPLLHACTDPRGCSRPPLARAHGPSEIAANCSVTVAGTLPKRWVRFRPRCPKSANAVARAGRFAGLKSYKQRI